MLAAPIHRAAIPLGKLLSIGLQTMLQALIIAIIALCLGVRFETGVAGIAFLLLVAGLFGVIMGSISLSLAAKLTSFEALMAITNFLTMPLMFTSNAMFPTNSMPGWLQAVAHVNPLSYAVHVMRTVATKGWIFDEIWLPLLLLFCIAGITVSISIRMFSHSVR